jgi:hypothetical protein
MIGKFENEEQDWQKKLKDAKKAFKNFKSEIDSEYESIK